MSAQYLNKNLDAYTFLVTGGAGFIGSHIVEYLVKHKAGGIIILDNLSTGNFNNIKPFSGKRNFRFIKGDIGNLEICRKACKGVDFVLHQAALGSVPRSVNDPLATHHSNATGFLNMLIAARDAGVKRFIYASSSSVYGNDKHLPKKEHITGAPLSPYAVTKLTDELYAKVFSSLYRMDIIGLRYFNVFGPRQNVHGPYAAAIPIFITSLLKKRRPVIFGDGSQKRDFTYVDNAVYANICSLFCENKNMPGRLFNIAAGKSLSVLSLFRLVKNYLNSGIQPVSGKARPGEIQNSLADISLAKKMLSYRPVVDMKEGLKRTIEWYCKQNSKFQIPNSKSKVSNSKS